MDIQNKRKEINRMITCGITKAECMTYCPLIIMMGLIIPMINHGFTNLVIDICRGLLTIACITVSAYGFKQLSTYKEMQQYSHDDKFIIYMYDNLHKKQGE